MNSFKSIKEKIRFWLADSTTPVGKAVDIFLLVINITACAAFVLESIPAYANLTRMFFFIEWILVSFFSIEYIFRYWAAHKKLQYIFSLMSFIDILSILPSVLAFGDFRFLRILRVFRIFRFARFFKNHIFFFGEIRKIHLHAARIIFSLIALVFTASGLIYNIEGKANPELFSSFFDAVYFSLVTITTVGFGDIIPVSFYGKLATLFIICLGVIIIPWQVGSLIRDIVLTHKKYIVCRKCGLQYHDPDAIHCKLCGEIIYQENIGM